MGPAVRRLLPYVIRYRRAFVLGLVVRPRSRRRSSCCRPWILKHAIDDLNARRHAREARAVRGASARRRAGRARVPVPDAAHHHRRLARHRVRPPQRLLRAPRSRCRSAYYQAQRTGDLMSRATNDLNAVRMMIGPAVMYSANTVLVFVVAHHPDADDRRAADADRADAAAVRLDQRQVLRQRDPHALRGHPGAAVRHQRGRAGSAVRRPRGPRLRPGGARARAVPRRERRVPAPQSRADPAAGRVLSEHDAASSGFGSLLVLWLGSRDVIRGRITLGEFVAFNALPGDAQLADDRVRLGHQHPAARAWRRGSGCSRSSTPFRTIDDAGVTPAGRRARHSRRGSSSAT